MGKQEFISIYKTVRAALNETLVGLDEVEANLTTGPDSEGATIKDVLGNLAAWEREVLIADEMIKRGEESYLPDLKQEEFNREQAAHRRSWPLAGLKAELELNYEALLMAWDEYEGEDGPFGSATWQPNQPHTLWWLLEQQARSGREIARRRGLLVTFPI